MTFSEIKLKCKAHILKNTIMQSPYQSKCHKSLSDDNEKIKSAAEISLMKD